MKRAALRRTLPLLAVAALSGCERAMHDMYDQPKYQPLAPSALFADGNSARTAPPGSVARSAGAAADSSGGRLGAVPETPAAGPVVPVDAQGRDMAQGDVGQKRYANPLAPTMALLQRGRQRFEINCAPCHGPSGYGDGMIVKRGFPAPPSYHAERLRNAADSHFYQVITHGYGVMYPYADRVAPRDRWAIVAYIRALQLSQHAPADRLDSADFQRLTESAPASPAAAGKPREEAQ